MQRAIALMESFVAGSAISTRDAEKLEDALRSIAEEDSVLEHLADQLAQYAPGGGDYLYDYKFMKPRVARQLDVLRNQLK